MTKRVIFTDLIRSQKKVSFNIMMGIVILIIIGIAVVVRILPGIEDKGKGFVSGFNIITTAAPFLAGIPVYSAIITDDFKSRTMQIAIGRGISRSKLILCRFFEAAMMLAEAFIVYSIVTVITGLIMGSSAGDLGITIGKLWVNGLLILAHISICMFLAYGTLNPTVGLVFFILFSAGVFSLMLNLLDGISFFKDNGIQFAEWVPSGIQTKINNYGFGQVANEALDIAAVAKDAGKAILNVCIMIGAYMVVPIALAQTVFRKKELDF